MILSQKKAKLILRREAGFSVALADSVVRSMPKITDGRREKVKLADLQRIINEANRPTPITRPDTTRTIRAFRSDSGFRQLSK